MNNREIVKLAVVEADKKYIKNKNEINNELEKALNTKYEKVNKDEEKYVEILRYNIIFYKSIIKKLESILEMWIQNDIISSADSVEKSIENITSSSRKYVNNAMKHGNSYLNDKDKKIFKSYDKNTGLKRIEKIENDYKILNLYKDIFGMVISVISSDVKKYKTILDMSLEEVKVELMNEIFKEINEILFAQRAEEVDFKDEALVDDDSLDLVELEDDDKSLSFIKYVSMISTPEISVKINDIFSGILEDENLEEDELFLFSEDMKNYVSCVVLLMDYISLEKRKMFENAFKFFATGSISEDEFKEVIEKLVKHKTFVDRRRWNECQKLVKSDFNIINNNFFGKNTDREKILELSLSEVNKIIEDFDSDSSLIEFVRHGDSLNEDVDIDKKSEKFSEKIKRGFFSFSDKLKPRSDYDAVDDEFGEEYYDDEYEPDFEEENDEEYYEEEYYDEGEKRSFRDRIKSIFTKTEEDSEYDDFDEYDEDEDLYEIEESDIQDKNAVAILKLKEKSKKRDNEAQKKELNELKDERQLIEEFNKNNASNVLTDNPDIVIGDDDSIYRKNETEAYDFSMLSKMFDEKNKIENMDSPLEMKSDEGFDTNKKLDIDDNLESKVGLVNDKTMAKSKSDVDESKNHDKVDIYDGENLEDTKSDDDDFDSEDTSVFEELELLKTKKVDLGKKDVGSRSRKSKETNRDEVLEEDEEKLGIFSIVSSKKDKLFERFNEMRSKEDGEFSDETTIFSKKKMVRDTVIVVVILVMIFFSYIFIIRGFSVPSVEETNANTKKIQRASTSKNQSGVNNSELNKNTTKITQKTEEEKERDEVESKASALDREAENYKGTKGVYYTVFAGASKDKDGLDVVGENFANRGVKTQTIRNAGYYMLKDGEFFSYNEAYAESRRLSAKGIQNYIAARNKYFDLKIEAYKTRIPNLNQDQLKTDYNDLRNQISSSGKNSNYVSNLDEIYNEAVRNKQ